MKKRQSFLMHTGLFPDGSGGMIAYNDDQRYQVYFVYNLEQVRTVLPELPLLDADREELWEQFCETSALLPATAGESPAMCSMAGPVAMVIVVACILMRLYEQRGSTHVLTLPDRGLLHVPMEPSDDTVGYVWVRAREAQEDASQDFFYIYHDTEQVHRIADLHARDVNTADVASFVATAHSNGVPSHDQRSLIMLAGQLAERLGEILLFQIYCHNISDKLEREGGTR